jgi:hypothetical protein
VTSLSLLGPMPKENERRFVVEAFKDVVLMLIVLTVFIVALKI